jgi:hypothetical protein
MIYVFVAEPESRKSLGSLALGFLIPVLIAWFLSPSLFAPLSG